MTRAPMPRALANLPGGVDRFVAVYNDRSSNVLTRQQALGMSHGVYSRILRWLRDHDEYGPLLIDRQTEHAAELSRNQSKTSPARVADVRMDIPADSVDIDELWDRRERNFARVKEREEFLRVVPVSVDMDGPIGILFVGDPHVDDDGTDVRALRHHARLVRETEGLWAANVGDTTNNWVGRLARLYGSQSTSEQEAVLLAESWLRSFSTPEGRTKWLFLVGGNHDVWHGDTRDPIRWISGQMGALYQSSEVRVRLDLPSGKAVTINARHDFPGHSMWNPAHGVGRAVQMGAWDDISVCGHRHVSGYMVLRSPQDGRVCHAIQVASYKLYDRYAREKGFRDQRVSPATLAVIDPHAVDPAGVVTVYHDIDTGVEFLKFLRARHAQGANDDSRRASAASASGHPADGKRGGASARVAIRRRR